MGDSVLAAYAGTFVDELYRSGVREVCVAPGSRSTPLAMMVDQHPGIRVWMHLDERSCSFFALGMAKAARRPVAVLCTSGTAAAEMYPAVIEARYGRVPLLILTADRPSELREVGAPQTIDQLHLYGGHVKWFADVALPDASERAIRYVLTTADRAVATATAAPAGPVHLNFPFREPLVPAPLDVSRSDDSPLTRVEEGRLSLSAAQARRVVDELSRYERGLIICGPYDAGLGPAVYDLASALAFPLLADPLSQARCGPAGEGVISTYDAFMRDPSTVERLIPDVILRLGAVPTSKPLTQYLQRHAEARHIVVDVVGWNDPLALASDIIHADPERLLADLAAAVSTRPSSGWEATWREIECATRRTMHDYLADMDEPFEGKVFSELATILPPGAALYAGSSMPVRDLDTFFPAGEGSVRFLSNRGANGIDGVVSSALGASTVLQPLVLVVGDISFYHDMNGLLASRLHALNATIIVLNNDGGGIFSFLPQHGEPGFETLFGTPHGLDFEPAVRMYGGTFARVTDWTAFGDSVRAAIASPGLHVVEIPTERERNVRLHRELWVRVAQAVSDARRAAV